MLNYLSSNWEFMQVQILSNYAKIKIMNRLSIMVCLGVLVFSCSPNLKNNSNTNKSKQIHELAVFNFSEIPKDLLVNLNKMGVDSSPILNEYEGKYLNFIFKISPQDFNFIGKKVGFIKGKIDYFRNTRERFNNNSSVVGGSGIYIFNTTQKIESGGYDAAIVYWNKFSLPIEEVIKRLK
ncbi:hypothetical protein Q787_11480 [Ornithobacterium rhinotracheale H06-030791]|nr:hypothetical protein Q785_11945 [Ornithobacterium rhinotracheale ORT-UMN 88]KGB65887.1 hypothetical protein Q787_11480 [Ornithobacterium rhinotracheale H06-030791]